MYRRVKMMMAMLAVVGVTFGIAVGAASATAGVVGGGWQAFTFGPEGVPAPESPFTFTAATAVAVTVTDAFCQGDGFTISDGSNTLGTTGAVSAWPECTIAVPGWTGNPDTAFADPTFSHGVFVVGAGSHSIGVVASTSPYFPPISGQGFIRFDTLTLTADGCKEGGWQAYLNFKNQGDCVSFVATGGKNLPAGG
jgi:hypothetical protein